MAEPTTIQTKRERLSGGGEYSARCVGQLLPHRGDEVAEWLKEARDHFEGPQGGWAYRAIDGLLDEYRLRADLGLALIDELSEEDNR